MVMVLVFLVGLWLLFWSWFWLVGCLLLTWLFGVN